MKDTRTQAWEETAAALRIRNLVYWTKFIAVACDNKGETA